MSQSQDCYVDWRELESQIKALRTTQGEILSRLAESKGIKKGKISAAFRYRKKMEDKGEDELDDVVALFMELGQD